MSIQLLNDMSNEEFEAEFLMEKTPENVNWMYAVQELDDCICGTDDLVTLLKELDDNYSGKISIHEDFGGCDASCNRDLITEKLLFDLAENTFAHNSEGILEAIRLGWITLTVEGYIEQLEERLEFLEEFNGRETEIKLVKDYITQVKITTEEVEI